MDIFDSLFGRKLFKPQPDDVKMWQSAGQFKVCEPCKCLEPQYGSGRFGQLHLHSEAQDTACEAWKLLESLVESAVTKQSKEFAPGLEMPAEMWSQIITLPRSIAGLTSVRRLYLYGSNLVRIPPEIGALKELEELDIYTSYRLHWLPFEVTRCPKLKHSRASTRALYGNYKYRPPFPRLGKETSAFASGSCSVCGRSLPESVLQVWISVRVATDVFPLLVNACSDACIKQLPQPPAGYVDHPHTGGLHLVQPRPGQMVRGVVVPDQD
ncbi:MAG: leucine-rich repeat domain-containing protein [Verrucomicrobiota bacterium]